MLLIINAIFFYTFFLPNLLQYTPEFLAQISTKKTLLRVLRLLAKFFSKLYFLRFYFLYNSKNSRTISKSSKWCLTPLISW